MRKLLYANFSRLKKDKVFWITLLCTFILSLVAIFNGARSAEGMALGGAYCPLDRYFFEQAPYMGAFFAIFISFFLGTDYSDGAIRNKLSVGHTRNEVYVSDFLVCLAGSLCMTAAWLFGSLPGLFLIGPFDMGTGEVLCYILVAVGFTATFTAMYTWIGMASANKAFTVVFTLILWVGLILIASGLHDRLLETEFNGGMAMINGQFVDMEKTPNPLYLRGKIRLICEILRDLLPSGQAILMTDAEIEHPLRQVSLSLIFTVLALWGGMITFRKKDLR